ncbi:probable DNA metabolism protein [Soonwooa buanensis]|uniref:Probable DNA metabolism protein n=1 Tax=Soonwooa buanensis TaxID=619805 RepID=A0A1T5DNG9_9FLAO|nr:TIGR03915 family putative DNA repair protein [Soonwooa buanensis]SKB73165.1 probable DNA metabolism protein [Soonwooa buanensis]
MIYSFDGSYQGFLTALFESFERKHFEVSLVVQDDFFAPLFEEVFDVVTDFQKAQRVQKGLHKVCSPKHKTDIFKVFLSEKPEAWKALIYIVQKQFLGKKDILDNYGDAQILLFHKTLTSVDRERHRMKAFVRFQKSEDGMFYCMIEPDFNVLPLISDFFRKRYADQKWLIYDVKRKYGVLYDQQTLSEVYLTPHQQNALTNSENIISFDETEEKYQTLWQQYFKSTNIEARKNMKLHLQHVPRRYWKYLVEKQM